ncbi:MAG: hypothetical protein FWH53_08050 [Leptospirales bacterium]|nr:hypothetical protein [Leptospirales bacterium]
METLKELLYSIGSFLADKIRFVIDWFMELNIFNKIIVANTIISFFAITLPIAKYYIFETWFFINNPVAVYLIFITVFMLVTIFFHGQFVLAARVILNLWYFIYVVYMYSFNTISKAPYVLSKGFVFNLIAPIVYLAVSVLLYFFGEE